MYTKRITKIFKCCTTCFYVQDSPLVFLSHLYCSLKSVANKFRHFSLFETFIKEEIKWLIDDGVIKLSASP